MFEAHHLSADELKTLLQPAPCWLKTYSRTHAASLQPLRIWFAEGKRKDAAGVPRRTRFVYVEYRDDRGDNRYRCVERPAIGAVLDALLAEAVRLPLPGCRRAGAVPSWFASINTETVQYARDYPLRPI